MGTVHRPHVIDLHDALDYRHVLDVGEFCPHGHAGVEYEGVDAAKFGNSGINQVFAICLAGDITGDHQGARAAFLADGAHLVRDTFEFINPARGQHQMRALLRELTGEFFTDAGGCAGDDGDIVFEAHYFSVSTSGI